MQQLSSTQYNQWLKKGGSWGICDPGPRNIAIERSWAQLPSVMQKISQGDLSGALKFIGIPLFRFYTLTAEYNN